MQEYADELFLELVTEIRFGDIRGINPVRCLAHGSMVGFENAVFRCAEGRHLWDLGRRFWRFGEHVLWGWVP